MKKLKILVLAITTITSLVVFNNDFNRFNSVLAASTNKKVTVGTMGTYRPYSYKTTSGKITGFDVEVTRALTKIDPGLKFTFKTGQFDSLFTGLDSNRYQMLANQIVSNPDRQKNYYMTKESYAYAGNSIIVKKSNNAIKNLTDLEGKKVAATVGDSHTIFLQKWNKKHGNKIKIVMYKDDITHILQDIQLGRVDATINDASVARDKAKEEGLNVKPVGKVLAAQKVRFIFKKTNNGKTLRNRIDKDLTKLKNKGTIGKISNKYLNSDVTKK
ncbi:transporter substrate-binding domain-containing protein [Loigolactobacillus backii]|uniref:transporter substrate-binding domain-containing protein n=1 Tax=Loigolactobacillus backii TaxID=375175 RepID=UPI000C1C9CC6|nr:transporter substrate-binding domain-containing protein [Loigolactobacillus backii]MDA5388948.1 transporter substrate-binding domain-containing protein [Loigolactobacillus backii]MDA5391455.1 transporter substrate-binding domain-containing protein [Loigolactobacillus backii]PIO82638.1 hypothetical protein BSQ39_03160 [Loigolactobacillus backii]